MSVSLVAVSGAVSIAVHAGALSGAGRHAGVRHGAAEAGRVVEDPGLGDEIALPRVRALAQEVDAPTRRRGMLLLPGPLKTSEKLIPCTKRNTVSTFPSWRNPKPRT